MRKKLSRRTLLKTSLIVSGGALAASLQIVKETLRNAVPTTTADTPSTIYIPMVVNGVISQPPRPPGSEPRVVHVHANNAHNWNNSAENYWDYVNQNVVDNMVDQGVMQMTGQSSVRDAWRSLMPNYQGGQVVAIKVSFNNCQSKDSPSVHMIDGIIEPVNAIIRGLHAADVPYSDIVVYDSSRWLPARFTSKCLYPGIRFRDSGNDPWGAGSAEVTFTPPGVQPFNQRLSKEVAMANYLINIPIMKGHGSAGFSLALKNHYGSVQKPGDLHSWTSLAAPSFSTQYNPIVDINKNPHIANKTILTVGDAIFASNSQDIFPTPWVLYNNQTPKSLFFSADPVAIDCVMIDHKYMERKALGRYEDRPIAYSYLPLAEAAGLGVYEHPDPNINTFSKIDYQAIEL